MGHIQMQTSVYAVEQERFSKEMDMRQIAHIMQKRNQIRLSVQAVNVALNELTVIA